MNGRTRPSLLKNSLPAATMLPNNSGMAGASPTVMVLSLRCAQAFFRSNSMAAIHTKS